MRSPTAFFLTSGLLSLVRAAPAAQAPTGCDVSQDVIPVPAGQSILIAPANEKPIYIAAGIGTQNYSCDTTGTYTSIGAVAILYDVSCVYNAINAIGGHGGASSATTAIIAKVQSALGSSPLVLGHHYFVTNPTGAAGTSPKFDFTSDSQSGNPDAFVVTAKTAGIPAPHNPTINVDWLELAAIPGQGDLAKHVFRIFTVGGQPPASCTPGSLPIEVPYIANYWFFK